MRILAALACAALLAGCTAAWPASRYRSQIQPAQVPGDGPARSVSVGSFKVQSPDIENVRLRITPMISPVGSFARYLEDAVRQELGAAGLLDSTSDLELSGIFLRNDVSAGGRADLEASFRVQRAGAVLYEQTKSAHHEWWSPWAASATIAVTAATENYPVAVWKLIRTLIGDPEFQRVLKK